MKFQFNDGGRATAGFAGKCGDCVTRAVAIATQLPYAEVYAALAQVNAGNRKTRRSAASTGRRTARSGIYTNRKAFKDYITSLGWTWTPTMGIGTGCTVHLREDELPAGRLIVSVSRHYTAVIDGVIHDTHDPSKRGTTIYPPSYLGNIPKGAKQQPNGDWFYAPDRCVYGYWSKPLTPNPAP